MRSKVHTKEHGEEGEAVRLPSSTVRLRCYDCGVEAVTPTATRCRSCDGSLAVVAKRSFNTQRWLDASSGEGLWRFAPLLAPVSASSRTTLFEGDTPLVEGGLLAAEVGVATLLLKDETRNPTGTFKDRCLAVAASVAVDCGAPGLVCASTGNAGAATAAYAARAGLPAVILVPTKTPASKLAQALIYGARVVTVDGTYSDAYRLAQWTAEELGYVNTTTTFVSPYSVEGARTLAYELHERLNAVPDWISVPIGAGPLLVAIHQAYEDLREAGLVDRVPRLLAVQASGCAPIVRAFLAGAAEVTAWDEPDTCVGSLADPLRGYEREGRITLDAIRASGGGAIGVSDDETLAWIRTVASRTGIFAEPGAAISVAGARRAVAAGFIAPDATIVCCLTGSGLKDPYAAIPNLTLPTIPAERDALRRWL